MVIEIINADYLSGYKINFTFSDGVEKVIDFEPFLNGAKNPMSKRYLDVNLFKDFSISYGDIIWNDYEMCFPIWDLHEGNI